MSGRSGIVWTDYTWNPVVGCTKVSQGCKLCYAKTLHDMRHRAYGEGKMGVRQYAEPFETVQLIPSRLDWPLSLRKPSKIFVNSMSDLFHEDVPDTFILSVFSTMHEAGRHTFQILTKRPARMRVVIAWLGRKFEEMGIAWPLPNVWLGVSVEDQESADERIPLLLQTPAAVRFLSCEPLLGSVDLTIVGRGESAWFVNALTGEEHYPGSLRTGIYGKIDWVIAGGESGSSKLEPRPMHPDWVRSLRDQCVNASVPFLFKQWGDWAPAYHWAADPQYKNITCHIWPDGSESARYGTRRAGRELDGHTWDEYPEAQP